jgi:hypothetical protein
VENIQIEEETELTIDIGQTLNLLKKHGIRLRAQKKRPLTHAPSSSGKKMNWRDAWKEQRKQSVKYS